jgi:malonate-semialdehyde dehydrogenase (acetylating)/methylmalonate-semialdehyde dehydrogenase
MLRDNNPLEGLLQVIIPTTKSECKNFVDNQFVAGTGPLVPVISPYIGSVIGEYHQSTVGDVSKAVDSAQRAQREWGLTPIKERSRIMFNWREILLKNIDQYSHVVASESGKTWAEAKAGLSKGVEVLEFALSLQNLDLGGKIEVSRGVHCEYRREPLGVIANITPFNFPAMVPMWTLPIALTLGNAYVWKPSEKTPLTSNLLAQSLKEAGLPPGLLQVIQGDRSTVEAIIDNPLIKAIGFVGSTAVAKAVYERGTGLGKRVLALGGAKNHIVLLPDANLELSGMGISDSFTGCAGQRCMAASVVLAVGDVNQHLDRIVARADSLKLGVDMGAIISRKQVEFLSTAIESAIKAGAKVLLDGRQKMIPQNLAGGFWIGPTILDQVNADMECCSEELFGPILSIVRCDSIAEAMKIENKNPYGNACSVFTSSGALAEKVIQSAKSGMVGVNVGVPVPREPFSFGGINSSKFGHGDITGHHSLDFWTNLKKVTTKWEAQADQTWMS